MQDNLYEILLEFEQGECYEYNPETFTDKLSILFAPFRVNNAQKII